MKKYRDYFTEKSYYTKFINKEYLELLPVKIPKDLIEKIPGPINDNNIVDLVLKIRKSSDEGKDHLLYQEWINKYNSDNIIIPLLVLSKESFISYRIILSSDMDSFRIARKNVTKDDNFKILMHDSIISTTDDKHWKSQRLDLLDAFSLTSLSSIIDISADRAKKSVSILDKLKQPVNMADYFLNETMAQLLLALFKVNPSFEKNNNKIIRNGLAGLEEPGKIREKAFELLKEIKDKDGPLSNILNERNPETDTEKYGNALIFLFAGHDTTGLTLTWLLYELARNQNIQIKLQKEVDKFWAKQGNRKIELKDFRRLPFMTRCIMETLRLWTAVPNGTFRELQKDMEIHSNNELVTLPKGSKVQIFNWSKHRNKRLWGDDADIFNPNRKFKSEEIWNESGYGFFNPSTNRFSPFLYSPRDCIGKNFAHMEMRLILLNIFKNYHFILSKEQSEKDPLKNSTNNATLAPADIYKNEDLVDKIRKKRVGMYCYFMRRKNKL